MWLEAGRSICWGLQPGKLLRPEWSAGLRGAGPEMVEEMGERVKGGILEERPIEHRQRTNCSAFDNDSANDPASTSSWRREIGHNTRF